MANEHVHPVIRQALAAHEPASLTAALRNATATGPLLECDGFPLSPGCLGEIQQGEAVSIDRETYCPPCALRAAAQTLARWTDPGFTPDAGDIRDAQDARHALAMVLAQVDVRIREWK